MKMKTALIIFGVVIAALLVYGFVIQPLLVRVAAR
jgi:ABC-type antimicrobial peptide transport system permease subunit